MNKIRYGLKARHDDLDFIYSLRPELIEFHFSNKDTELKMNGKHYDCLLAVHLPEYWQSQLIDFSSSDEKLRKFTVDVYNQALDKVRYLIHWFNASQKPIVAMHAGAWSNTPSIENDSVNVYRQFMLSWKALNKNGLDVTVENLPPYPWYYGGRWYTKATVAPESMKFISELSGAGITFDLCHAALWANSVIGENAQMELERFYQILAGKIRHIHIADAVDVDGEGLQIGEGKINWARMIALMADYKGVMVPEVWFGHKDEAAGFKECIKRVNSYCNKMAAEGGK